VRRIVAPGASGLVRVAAISSSWPSDHVCWLQWIAQRFIGTYKTYSQQ